MSARDVATLAKPWLLASWSREPDRAAAAARRDCVLRVRPGFAVGDGLVWPVHNDLGGCFKLQAIGPEDRSARVAWG